MASAFWTRFLGGILQYVSPETGLYSREMKLGFMLTWAFPGSGILGAAGCRKISYPATEENEFWNVVLIWLLLDCLKVQGATLMYLRVYWLSSFDDHMKWKRWTVQLDFMEWCESLYSRFGNFLRSSIPQVGKHICKLIWVWTRNNHEIINLFIVISISEAVKTS